MAKSFLLVGIFVFYQIIICSHKQPVCRIIFDILRSEWLESDKGKTLFNTPPAKYLFSSQYSLIARGMSEDEYLAECQQYQMIWSEMVKACGFDPFVLLTEYFLTSENLKIKPAAKHQQNYFPVVLRDLHFHILPHADFGPFDGKNWAIDQVVKQIAWNIYLTDPVEGGETIIYDHVWQGIDEVAENSYAISEQYAETTRFSVKPGQLVLFNSRNLHAVLASKNERIAIGGLLGLTANNEIIAWG